MNVVVGVGYVGRRLLDSLPVDARRGLSRSAAGDDLVTLNLDDTDLAPIELPDRCAVIYTVPPARDQRHDARLVQFLAALRRPPERFVYLSTTGVYGDRQGESVDETTSVRPGSDRAKRRVDAERRLADYSGRHGTKLLVLRVPGIYGPGRLGTERIQSGEPVLDEADANPGNRIHVDDLVACCLAALREDAPAGVYNLGDGDERSSSWFATEVARQLGEAPPPTVSRGVADQRFSARRLSFLAESRRVDITKMKTILGVMPRYGDAAVGIAASLAEEQGVRP